MAKPKTGKRGELRQHRLLLLGVAAIVAGTFIVYSPAIRGGFLFDDDKLITENEFVRSSGGLCDFWFTAKAHDYWPVTNTTFWIEWRLWGVEAAGYRLTNLLLHVGSALLIWAILRELSIPGALAAAVLFAIHPVNVQSVSWISERKNTLALFFCLWSLLFYVRFLKRPTLAADAQPLQARNGVQGGAIAWYLASWAAFVLAMLSKGSVATLPLVLLAIAWWLHDRLQLRDVLRIVPFAVIAAILTCVNIWFQTHGHFAGPIRTASLAERLSAAGAIVWFYLGKALLPVHLIFVYPQWHVQTGSAVWWIPLAAAITVSVSLYRTRDRAWGKPLLFAWALFLVTLAPVLGFADTGFMKHALVSDHYLYLSIISVVALAATAWTIWHETARDSMRLVATGCGIAVVVLLAVQTWTQNVLYRDAKTLYAAAVTENPGSWLLHNELGLLYDEGGRERLRRWSEPDVRRRPILGAADEDTIKRRAAAIAEFELSIELNPNDAAPHANLAYILARTNRLDEAIAHYRQALALDPRDVDVRCDLGAALLNAGRVGEAMAELEQAIDIRPDIPEAHYNLGNALLNMHRPQDALKSYHEAIDRDANLAEAHANMASCYLQLERRPEAIAAARRALELARSQNNVALAEQLESWLGDHGNSER